MNIASYLTFNGNCREAMLFYQECLGGQLEFQTLGDSPLGAHLPEEVRNCILHSTLTKGSLVLMGTDMVDEEGLSRGNAVSLCLQCNSEKEIRTCYELLGRQKESGRPLEQTFWGALFGDLTDRFGNRWLLNYDNLKNQTHEKENVFHPDRSTPNNRMASPLGR